MKQFDFTSCSSLDEFYSKAKAESKKAHGEDYTIYLDRLHALAAECETYKELGVMQGISAAAVGTGNPSIRMTLVDKELHRFRKNQHLFPHEIILWEGLSHQSPSDPCDLLFIDSDHTPGVLEDELRQHGGGVRKFIVAHDTKTRPRLRAVLEKFAGNRRISHDDRSCGFTIIWM